MTVGIVTAACSGDDDATSDTTADTAGPVDVGDATVVDTRGDLDSTPATVPATTEAPFTYRATIRRTSYNIPHITADDFGSLGYGYGYAFAEDHLCSLADVVVQARSEAASFFGPGIDDWMAEPGSGVRGPRPLRTGGGRSRCRRSRTTRRDRGLRGRLQPLSRRHRRRRRERILRRGTVGASDRRVRPRRLLQVAVVARQRRPTPRLHRLGHSAGRPGHDRHRSDDERETSNVADAEGAAGATDGDLYARALDGLVPNTSELASNAWAIGPDRTVDGTTMLVGNPHFPWQGALRFYEAQLTVPGELDVYGVSLLGSPAINIGFTDGVAWSNTVSAGRRFTAYTLDLIPGDPTRYRYGDEERAMTNRTVSVDVLAAGRHDQQGRAHVLVQPLRADHRLPWSRLDRYSDAHVPRRQCRQRRVDPAVHGDGRGRVDGRHDRGPRHVAGHPVGEHDRGVGRRDGSGTPTRRRPRTCPTPRSRHGAPTSRPIRSPRSRSTTASSCSTAATRCTSGSTTRTPATPDSCRSTRCRSSNAPTSCSTPTTRTGSSTPTSCSPDTPLPTVSKRRRCRTGPG